ncbi:hypothetical protein I3843_02G015600 [Carya illinoinensis]|uniref:Uncharacterized protein n=1 Tax=Carya illinoinensis TaxID=32201 RepID=A0A922K1I8_CARIL|nr:hypothetical protein I3842_02G022200 [Carya illinoinensis]KAG7990241.1 hypothetical protein I3843_02G015600 [Carya illinoinensis]
MDNKADILLDLSHVDLPSLGDESDHLSCHINAYGSLIDLRETHSRTDVLKRKGLRSEEELGIRRDLEEEIKEGIYHHALRLHRLYQQQKERKNKTLLEVNISIRMEGGAKIEIKETKKDHGGHDHERGRVPRTASARSENKMKLQLAAVPQVNANTKKFDWVKSLRSNAGPVGNLQYQAKTFRTNRCCYLNLDGPNNGRRVCSASTSSTSEKPAGQGLRKR